MFFKVLIVVSIIKICSGGPPHYPQSKNHAVSSHSFVREDVPLSYKYSAVHVYTPKSSRNDHNQQLMNNYNRPGLNPINYAGIQYAPLPLKREEAGHKHGGELYANNAANQNIYDNYDIAKYTTETSSTVNKEHLEPKAVNDQITQHPYVGYSPFVSGHNIHILQSMNRQPGISTLLRPISPTPQKMEYDGNNFSQSVIYQTPNQKSVVATTAVPKVSAYTSTSYSTVSSTSDKLNGLRQLYEFEKQAELPRQNEKSSGQFSAVYAKVPRLHLNIARGYNIAVKPNQAQHKTHRAAPLDNGLFSNIPSNTQALIQSEQIAPFKSITNNTNLYPVKSSLYEGMFILS